MSTIVRPPLVKVGLHDANLMREAWLWGEIRLVSTSVNLPRVIGEAMWGCLATSGSSISVFGRAQTRFVYLLHAVWTITCRVLPRVHYGPSEQHGSRYHTATADETIFYTTHVVCVVIFLSFSSLIKFALQ